MPAGQLLDECGCRGLRVGDATVFPKHANIIVNAGHATAREVLELAQIVKTRVRERSPTTWAPAITWSSRLSSKRWSLRSSGEWRNN